jgi:hypothetical protein
MSFLREEMCNNFCIEFSSLKKLVHISFPISSPQMKSRKEFIGKKKDRYTSN